MSEFTIAISSTDSLDIHPGNKAERFTTHFPIPLTLDGSWEVAIKNITYPTNVLIIGHDCEFKITIDFIQNEKHILQTTPAVLVPPGHYKGVGDLIDYCVNGFYEYYPQHRKDELFEMREVNKMRMVYITSASKNTYLKFTKGEDLKAALGFQDYEINQIIQLPVLGASTIPYYSAISYFLVTCNIVQPSLYGEEYMSILQMERYMLDGKPRTVEYDNPIYYKVERSFIENITIHLLHPTKYFATFEYGETSMILSFRKSQEENFHIIVPSTCSVENTQTQFQMTLPKQINLKGHWVVALRAITYSNTYCALSTSEVIVKMNKDNLDTGERNVKFFKALIDGDRMLGVDSLLIAITKKLVNGNFRVGGTDDGRLKTAEEFEPWLFYKIPAKFSKDPFTNRMTMLGAADIDTKVLFTSKEVLKTLGFDLPNNTLITLPITATNPPSFFYETQGFLITSNILKPNHLGGGFSRVLVYEPLKRKYYTYADSQTMEIVKREYINPTYHELESNKIKLLQFKLVNLKGQLLTFDEGLTCLQLEFKHVE